MPSELVQITERQIGFDRVPIGQVPVVELHLEPDQRVVSCQLRSVMGTAGRVTEDWFASVQIETRLGVPDAN